MRRAGALHRQQSGISERARPSWRCSAPGKPKILEWKLLKGALSGIGLLKYYAGDFGDGEESSLEYVAIVDTRANKVVSIEPQRWGDKPATWNWQAVSVFVTDPDGNANEIQLRKARQQRARRRATTSGASSGLTARRRKPPRSAAAAGAAAAVAAGWHVRLAVPLIARLRNSLDMTLFLASVRDPAEAELALAAGADIVDLKDPGQGALGAVAPGVIAACVAAIAGRAPVSATIGDLPMNGTPFAPRSLRPPLSASTTSSSGSFRAAIRNAALNRLETARPGSA